MEIRTKFNVGDKVWIIDMYGGKWELFDSLGKWEIHGFKIFSDSIQCILFEENWRNKFNFNTQEEREKDIFLTKEEAQKESDRRNGSKGTED